MQSQTTENRSTIATPGAALMTSTDPGTQMRARVWGLLGALLSDIPSAELIGSLRKIEIPADEAGAPLAPAWAALSLAAGQADPAALDDEYHALFIGVARGELVPYGSWYMTGLLMEKPLAVLRADLRVLGIARREDVCEPEDHAGALCETMGLIIASSDEILPASQREFFEAHVEPWLGSFFSDLRKADAARFYASVGQFGEDFFRLEQQYFSLLA